MKIAVFSIALIVMLLLSEALGFVQQPRHSPTADAIVSPRRGARRRKISLSTSTGPPQPDRNSMIAQLRGGATASSPPLTRWIVPALSSALSYALYNLSIKLAGSSIHPMLGGVILQVVAAALGSVLLGIQSRNTDITASRRGLVWSICAGLAVGAAEILSFQVAATGAQASQSIPVMIGGSVAIGSILGAVVLRERLSVQGWLGVFLVVAGVACVATDPASSMGH